MTKKKRMYFTCDCGMDHEVTYYDEVDSRDMEARSLLLSGEMFVHVCPHCGEKTYDEYPVHYVNEEDKFMIFAGDRGMAAGIIAQQKSDDKITWDDGDDSWMFIASTSIVNERTIILSLENDLDFHFVEIMLGHILLKLKKENNEKKEYRKVSDLYLSQNDENDLIMEVEVEDHEGKMHYLSKEFDYALYKKVQEAFGGEIEGAMQYCFNKESALKLLKTKEWQREELRNRNCQFLITEDENGDEDVALVPPFNVNKYEKGDYIVTKKNGRLNHVLVNEIFMMSEYESPWRLNELPVAGFSCRMDPPSILMDENPADEGMRKMLTDYKDSGYKIGKMPVIALNDSGMHLAKIMNDVDGESRKASFMNYTCESGRYLCVFTSEDELPKNLEGKVQAFRYGFNDIMRLALNIQSGCDGIIINPENEKVIIPHKALLRYKSDRIMTIKESMKEYLSFMDEGERQFMGEKAEAFIKRIYFEGTTPMELASNDGITVDEVWDVLDGGYSRMMSMIQLKK